MPPPSRYRRLPRWLVLMALVVGLVPDAGSRGGAPAAEPQALERALPQHLHQTGLHAPGRPAEISADALPFSPQYPLWSDGATKRRWLSLPPGSFIDATQPDDWVFPVGTRLWKEFAVAGRPVETRLIERMADGGWRFATYVWNADASDAVLAPRRGIGALPVAAAPGGRYAVPSEGDCLACHAGREVPVLGVSALQLSSDRDPRAPNGEPRGSADLDLRALVARGWLRNLPAALLEQAPRIAGVHPVERAALGYLHANCAHCHFNGPGRAPVRLMLAQSVVDPYASRAAVLGSALRMASRSRPPGLEGETHSIVDGASGSSVLALRMASRDAQVQMPPLGTEIPDPQGLALVRRWIDRHLPPPEEIRP